MLKNTVIFILSLFLCTSGVQAISSQEDSRKMILSKSAKIGFVCGTVIVGFYVWKKLKPSSDAKPHKQNHQLKSLRETADTLSQEEIADIMAKTLTLSESDDVLEPSFELSEQVVQPTQPSMSQEEIARIMAATLTIPDCDSFYAPRPENKKIKTYANLIKTYKERTDILHLLVKKHFPQFDVQLIGATTPGHLSKALIKAAPQEKRADVNAIVGEKPSLSNEDLIQVAGIIGEVASELYVQDKYEAHEVSYEMILKLVLVAAQQKNAFRKELVELSWAQSYVTQHSPTKQDKEFFDTAMQVEAKKSKKKLFTTQK